MMKDYQYKKSKVKLKTDSNRKDNDPPLVNYVLRGDINCFHF